MRKGIVALLSSILMGSCSAAQTNLNETSDSVRPDAPYVSHGVEELEAVDSCLSHVIQFPNGTSLSFRRSERQLTVETDFSYVCDVEEGYFNYVILTAPDRAFALSYPDPRARLERINNCRRRIIYDCNSD